MEKLLEVVINWHTHTEKKKHGIISRYFVVLYHGNFHDIIPAKS